MSAVPPPRTGTASVPPAGPAADTSTGPGADTSAAPEAGRPQRPRAGLRALALALLFGVLGSSLVLLAAGKPWTRGTAAFGSSGLPVHADGSATTALPGALALVGLASLVAVFAVRRLGRVVVSALLALSGLGIAVTALARRGSHGAVDAAAGKVTGLSHVSATHVTTTSWPLVAVAGGVLLLLAGALALRYGRHWPAMSGTSRYERSGGPAAARRGAPAPVDPDRAEDLWKALDRGEDPTG